jgi:hypothetical protein
MEGQNREQFENSPNLSLVSQSEHPVVALPSVLMSHLLLDKPKLRAKVVVEGARLANSRNAVFKRTPSSLTFMVAFRIQFARMKNFHLFGFFLS